MAVGNRLVSFRRFTILATCITTLGVSPKVSLRGASGPLVVEAYSPVAPVQALLHAVRVNLKLVGDWLGDGDFESAAETVDRIHLLIDLCEVQSGEPLWRDRVRLLRAQCDQLVSLANKKDTTGAMGVVKECLVILGSLDADPPKGGSGRVEEFSPRSAVRSWMKLLDATYTDAKVAKSLDELTAMAYTIGEAANAAQLLRSDGDWRDRASEARGAALQVASLNRDTDLKVARQELKNVYERCQACHKAFKR